jgi:uncharacterized RDD family membrane protein YckC
MTTPVPRGVGRGRIGRMADAVTGRVVDTIDPDIVLDHVDVAAVIERIDLNRLLERVDANRLLDRIDIDRLAERVDIDKVIARVDIDPIIARVDIDRVIARVDIDQVIARVDIDGVIAQVDIDQVIDRVDTNRVLDRIDADRLLARVDLNKVLDTVDIERVVRRSGVPDLIAESTSRFAGSALDIARRQLVGLDAIVRRLVDRVLRRTRTAEDSAPEALRDLPPTPGSPVRGIATGHYAGPVSRACAMFLDVVLVVGSYALAYAGVDILMRAFFHTTLGKRTEPFAMATLVIGAFLYFAVSLTLTGRTAGKAVAGLRVTTSEGSPISARSALVRTLVFPFSLLLFGLGLWGIVLGRKHRSLHDAAADTVVIYDWGGRDAQLPAPLTAFLARREHDQDVPAA